MTTIPQEKRLEGRSLSKAILTRLQGQMARLKSQAPRPSLQVILVGDDPASEVYVRNKQKTCEQAGFIAKTHHLGAQTTPKQLQDLIEKLNHDPSVHGILLQLPLPKHLDPYEFLNLITPLKDVDGFNIINIGNLFIKRLDLAHVPCTAMGILRLLEDSKVPIAGKHAVVVGQSGLVGRPTSALLVQKGATVTLCHKQSTPLERYTRDADLLIVATGVKHLVGAKHVKEGAIVVDVGIHRTSTGLMGDVDAEAVLSKVSKLTPVPGGVGPMTIACLLENTWNAYERITQNAAVR